MLGGEKPPGGLQNRRNNPFAGQHATAARSWTNPRIQAPRCACRAWHAARRRVCARVRSGPAPEPRRERGRSDASTADPRLELLSDFTLGSALVDIGDGEHSRGHRCKSRYFEDLQPPSGTKLPPDLRPMMCRANGSPTCAISPGPSGRPGSRRADGVRSRSPRPVADTVPTATAPGAGQPLQERAPPASRTPPIHVRSDEGRGRVPHALCKAQAAFPDHEGRGDRRVLRTRRECNPIRYRS